MKLLDRNGLKPDPWVRSEEIVPTEALLVPVAALDAALAARHDGQRIGAALPNTYRPADLAPVQDRLELVAIDFPKFSDGRGFSIAKGLREQGYRGTLRASGALIPDQFAFALHVGFDEIELSDARAERQPVAQWLHALTLIHDSYQDGADGAVSILKRRRLAAGAGA
ncbi:MAG TPA: DUF934 domain-containing protein [Allosphingosinicella sp.]|nr:DUF934 domain-containing protein [Allosphingosinicella sp.]